MTSGRTVKTLAYLVAAMTAVTLVLGLVEPWTVALRPKTAAAQAAQDRVDSWTPLSAQRQAQWANVELMLAPLERDAPAVLPNAHVIVQSDGQVETTRLWRLGQPLPNRVLRICAVYTGEPTDQMLGVWLQACTWAARQMNVSARSIDLKTAAKGQAPLLPELQRRLNGLLRRQPAL